MRFCVAVVVFLAILFAGQASAAQDDDPEVVISFEPDEVEDFETGAAVGNDYAPLGLLGVSGGGVGAIDHFASSGDYALGPIADDGDCCPEMVLDFDVDYVITDVAFDVSAGSGFSEVTTEFPIQAFAISSDGLVLDEVSSVVGLAFSGTDPEWATISLTSGDVPIDTVVVTSETQSLSAGNRFACCWYLDNLRYTPSQPGLLVDTTSIPGVTIDEPYGQGPVVVELEEVLDSDGERELTLTSGVAAITGTVTDVQPLATVIMETPDGSVTLCESDGCELDADGQWSLRSSAGGELFPPRIEGPFELIIVATNQDGNSTEASIDIVGEVVPSTVETAPTTVIEPEPAVTGQDEPASPTTQPPTVTTSEIAVSVGDEDPVPDPVIPDDESWLPFVAIGILALVSVAYLLGRRRSKRLPSQAPIVDQPVRGDPKVASEQPMVRGRLEGRTPHLQLEPAPEFVIHAVLGSEKARTLLLERNDEV